MRFWLFAAAALAGTVAHFLYEPLGRPRVLVALLPVNESPWEHVKLVFWPLLAALAVLARGELVPWPTAVTAGFVGVMHAIAAMLGLHYAVRFGLAKGKPVLWWDILTYFVALASGWVIALGLLAAEIPVAVGVLSTLCLLVMAVFFDRGSLQPPDRHLFQDESKKPLRADNSAVRSNRRNAYGGNQRTKSA